MVRYFKPHVCKEKALSAFRLTGFWHILVHKEQFLERIATQVTKE